MITITKQKAKRFLLKKQLLLPPKSLDGLNGIKTVFETLRTIQYDPLNPCGRNPDLVLQARVKNIHPDDYHHWLYTEKNGIEVYDKELSIVPISDLEYLTHRNFKALHDKNKQEFLKAHQSEISHILEQIKEKGPISASDLKLNKQVKSGWGTTAQVGRIALETLWKMGQLTVVKREGMKKYYDLPNQKDQLNEKLPPKKIAKEQIIRRLKNVGMLPKSTTGGGWQGLSAIANIITQLIRKKELIEVKVEGAKLTYLILASDQKLITTELTTKPIHKSMVFLAPLDNLIWDRKMTEDLFDFHYRWEVYTPIIKRQFGYYVLPILYGEELIGRIEPLKKGSTLLIKGLWTERQWTKNEYQIFESALKKFAAFLNCSDIQMENKKLPLSI